MDCCSRFIVHLFLHARIEAIEEACHIIVELWDERFNVLLRPVPPFDALQARDRLLIEAVLDDACGIADHDSIRRYILCNNSACADHCPIADVYAAEQLYIGTDPDIVADDDLVMVIFGMLIII